MPSKHPSVTSRTKRIHPALVFAPPSWRLSIYTKTKRTAWTNLPNFVHGVQTSFSSFPPLPPRPPRPPPRPRPPRSPPRPPRSPPRPPRSPPRPKPRENPPLSDDSSAIFFLVCCFCKNLRVRSEDYLRHFESLFIKYAILCRIYIHTHYASTEHQPHWHVVKGVVVVSVVLYGSSFNSVFFQLLPERGLAGEQAPRVHA